MIAEAIPQARHMTKPLSVAKAAAVFEQNLKRPEVAAAIRGAYRAVETRDLELLVHILTAINGITALGPLLATLNGIADRMAFALLELMLEKFDEANALFAQMRSAQGLRRDGLYNRATAARRAANIWFTGAGLAAIERLIREERLPEAVVLRLSLEDRELLKEEAKPATLLLRLLMPRAERRESEQPRFIPRNVLRPGKTARDEARLGSREKRESRRRARQHARSMKPLGGKKK